MTKTGITTDCVCDLPEEYLKANGIDVIYFYITTATGRFRDGCEISSPNILEYLEDGGEKAETSAPAPEEYREFFENALKKYGELVHISISSRISLSCQNARAALELMGEQGKRVMVVDSGHLSTGIGHMVIKAVELRDAGYPTKEIAAAAESMKSNISTSFIAKNADYLYRSGRVSKTVKKLCSALMLHPVLTMREGRIALKTVKVGSYDRALTSYVRGELRRSREIDKSRLFITHAGCPVKTVAQVKAETEKLCRFNEVTVTKASATISGNCGSGTIGVLFVYK